MHRITYQGKVYTCRQGETVLETFLRASVTVPFSCRNGSCHTCMMQAKTGDPTSASQASLNTLLVNKSYFLPCKCIPQDDLNVKLPSLDDLYSQARVIKKEKLNDSVLRLLLETATPLYYHAGQFINIRRSDGLIRSYSLASMPKQDIYLELHIKCYPDGEMSQWLVNDVDLHQSISFHGPLGECYYRNDMLDKPLLLMGTGTGLAPLQGIVRDALTSNHNGEIYLYHGSSIQSGLYHQAYFEKLSTVCANFHYQACVSQQENSDLVIKGRADQIAFDRHTSLTDWNVFLAGNPDMVYSAFETAVQLGAQAEAILADPFECGEALISNSPIYTEEADQAETRPILPSVNNLPDDPEYPPADPEIWQVLDNGKLLSILLEDFYTQVYQDQKLQGFFEGVTQRRAVEKQYSFLRKIFTQEDVYFGDRPRNAHHWMVISDELFDYREKIMENCLRKHGLAEHLITRWLAMEEAYRCVIVKAQAWPKVVDGVVFPLEGFEEITMEVGVLCDVCQAEIDAGVTVAYHLRLGTVYCNNCRDSDNTMTHKIPVP